LINLSEWAVNTFFNVKINPLKTKRRLLHLKTQSVPRSKRFSSRYKNQSVYVVRSKSLFVLR